MKQLTITTLMVITMLFGKNGILTEGQPAPDFTLQDQDGKLQTLSDNKGKNIVVYFYPKDDTPGCTKEACGIRDNYDQFQESDIVVFGISYDSPESHIKFKKKYGLPFLLLSDMDKSVSEMYGAKGFLAAKRKTYLIDQAGIVFKIYEDVNVTSHAEDIIKEFQNR